MSAPIRWFQCANGHVTSNSDGEKPASCTRCGSTDLTERRPAKLRD